LAYFDLEEYNKTISDATIVLNNDPNSVPARSLLGRAFKTIHEYQKAEEQLTNAILIDETQAALYTGIKYIVHENMEYVAVECFFLILPERGDIRFRTNQKNKIIQAIYGKCLRKYSIKDGFEYWRSCVIQTSIKRLD
jgi:tetratricopeptide (TPR) repeat protein